MVVAVNAHVLAAVVDDDQVAEAAQPVGEHDPAAGHGAHGDVAVGQGPDQPVAVHDRIGHTAGVPDQCRKAGIEMIGIEGEHRSRKAWPSECRAKIVGRLRRCLRFTAVRLRRLTRRRRREIESLLERLFALVLSLCMTGTGCAPGRR